MGKNLTIRDLASRLGMSTATVSFALRNHPCVTESTRKKIHKLATKLGYKNNALVSALMQQVRKGRVKFRGEVLGFLTAYPEEYQWKQYYSHTRGFLAAQNKAEELGFRLDHFWLGKDGENASKVSKILRARGIRGSILPPTPWGIQSKVFDLDWNHHPIVIWDSSNEGIPVTRVTDDHFSDMLECYRKLRLSGHQRIGFESEIGSLEAPVIRWNSSYQTSQNILGGKKIPVCYFNNTLDKTTFLKWFDKHRPDAIIGHRTNIIIPWLLKHGVKIPDEISITSLDVNKSNPQHPAGMLQNHEGICAIAVELLAAQIFRNENGLPHTASVTSIKSNWINGWTFKPRSQNFSH